MTIEYRKRNLNVQQSLWEAPFRKKYLQSRNMHTYQHSYFKGDRKVIKNMSHVLPISHSIPRNIHH